MEDAVKTRIPSLWVFAKSFLQHVIAPKFLILIVLVSKTSIENFHLSNAQQMTRDCFSNDTQPLNHFCDTLTRILLNNCLQLFVVETTHLVSTFFIFRTFITTTVLLEPHLYCPFTLGVLSLCSIDIGRRFRGIVPECVLVHHKQTKAMLCHLHLWVLLRFKAIFVSINNYSLLLNTY